MKVNSNRYSLKWKNGVKRSKGTLFYTRPRNFLGETPLHTAVRHNAVRCVQLLLSDERTDPNIKDDSWGSSPLMVAVKRNRVACVELLLADPRVDLMTRDVRSERVVAR